MTKRVFFAIKIEISPVLLQVYEELKKNLSEAKIKWVDLNNLHVTLHFLGDTDLSLIQELISQIEISLKDVKPFKIELNKLGFFARNNIPTTLWIGLNKSNEMLDVYERIQRICIKNNIRSNGQAFEAHLTLGRIKDLGNNRNVFFDLLKDKNETVLHNQLINKIYFYESLLQPKGAIYKPIKIFQL